MTKGSTGNTQKCAKRKCLAFVGGLVAGRGFEPLTFRL